MVAVMTKRTGGRPASGGDEPATKLVRINADLADMISWITKIDGMSAGQFLDPMIRPQVVARFAMRLSDIRKLKAAEDAAAEAGGRDPGPPLPVVIVDGQRSDEPVKEVKKKGKG